MAAVHKIQANDTANIFYFPEINEGKIEKLRKEAENLLKEIRPLDRNDLSLDQLFDFHQRLNKLIEEFPKGNFATFVLPELLSRRLCFAVSLEKHKPNPS